MSKIETYGYIANGRLVLQNRNRFEQDIKCIPDMDVMISVESRGKRSPEQNSYYWGVVIKEIVIRMNDLGNETNAKQVHEYLKGRFNMVNKHNQHGELMEMPGSTTELDKKDFFEYVERVRRWAAEFLEINIPDPGTQTTIPFEKI